MIHDSHPYAQVYKRASEMIGDEEEPAIRIRLYGDVKKLG
jgi:hypothetical protein